MILYPINQVAMKAFFEAHPVSPLIFMYNPLDTDERMVWNTLVRIHITHWLRLLSTPIIRARAFWNAVISVVAFEKCALVVPNFKLALDFAFDLTIQRCW